MGGWLLLLNSNLNRQASRRRQAGGDATGPCPGPCATGNSDDKGCDGQDCGGGGGGGRGRGEGDSCRVMAVMPYHHNIAAIMHKILGALS